MKKYLLLGICILAWGSGTAQTVHIDSAYGYYTLLPDGWVSDSVAVNETGFRDSLRVHAGYLGIVTYNLSDQEKARKGSWTRRQILSYQLEFFPDSLNVGALVFLDTSGGAIIDSTWAPEALSYFYYAADSQTYMEYVTFLEGEHFGYELYAVSDSLDMLQNYAAYTSFLRTFVFFTPQVGNISIRLRGPSHAEASSRFEGVYDVMGRARRFNPPELPLNRNSYIRFTKPDAAK